MRDDPVAGERATLVVELDADADAAAFVASVERLGGTVEAELRFDSYRVALPEESVGGLTACDGLAVVETDNAVGYGGDAGEDVEGPEDVDAGE